MTLQFYSWVHIQKNPKAPIGKDTCTPMFMCVLSRLVLSDSLQPCGTQPARLLCPCGFSSQEYQSGFQCHPPGDLPNPGIKPRAPTWQADSLLSEPPRKPKNTGVGILSLLQGNLLTQELNQGLLHYRKILYQLSYPGSYANVHSSTIYNNQDM